MDAATIVTIAASIVGVGLVLGGWLWDTRNSVGKLEASFNKEIGELKIDFNKQISEVKEDLERQSTMIEPFWQTLCENLPALLKMHNSPDPLAAVLKGEPTLDDIDNLISRIQVEMKEAMDNNDNTKALGYIWALALVNARRKSILKKVAKIGCQ